MIPIIVPISLNTGSYAGPLIIPLMIMIVISCIILYMIMDRFNVNDKIYGLYTRMKSKVVYVLRYKKRKTAEEVANDILKRSKRLNQK